MDLTYIDKIIARWEAATRNVLRKEPIDLPEMQVLLLQSYQVLTEYHKDTLVPKQTGKLVKCMDDFLCFAAMVGENESTIDFYLYQQLHSIVESMERGFFRGQYACAFPLLRITDANQALFEIDLSGDFLTEAP